MCGMWDKHSKKMKYVTRKFDRKSGTSGRFMVV